MMFKEGQIVMVKYVDYQYLGRVIGISPTPDRYTREDTEAFTVSVQCTCCRLVEAVPERYVKAIVEEAMNGTKV